MYGAAGAVTTTAVAVVASSGGGAASSASASPAAATSTSSICATGVGCGSPSELRLDVVAFLDLGDVLGHGGVGADAVGIHKADQFGFGQVSWSAGFAVDNVGFGRFESFMQHKLG